jgi:hypothetical protein
MRGKYFEESQENPVEEIFIDFDKHEAFIELGAAKSPIHLGMALIDFGNFLMKMPFPEFVRYASYNEGEMASDYHWEEIIAKKGEQHV